MRRLFIIAAREYMSYARTAGFWLSLALLPIGLAVGMMAPAMIERSGQERTLALVDLTGRGMDVRVQARLT